MTDLFAPPSAWNLAGPVTLTIAATAVNALLDGPDWLALPILAVGAPLIYWRVRVEAEYHASQMSAKH
ncbi:hypothetical protein PM023_16055 [Halorubrum ezzemoulense]|uniref:hypothetical protein n=1 Tax=Halorubrum ezzemoulense TaxID=337243 RepID=UPI00232AF08E|nr:hypothetical protein [Halorubrum ezzemoulense]MDB2226160.1 hypothetical protein [Halorubrum ezzemoulense]